MGSENKFDNEIWIYINGIATTKDVSDTHRKLLFDMFGRPIHLLQNPTQGLLWDLFECFSWKLGLFVHLKTPPEDALIALLKKKLDEEKKVVLISHSQGTIITGNALNHIALAPKYLALMKKHLEVYNFANCAHQMHSSHVNYLENICNGRDLVAWLGHKFPFPEYFFDENYYCIQITGKRIEEPEQWGHLLNSHYLIPMMHSSDSGRRRYHGSKLWNYYDQNK